MQKYRNLFNEKNTIIGGANILKDHTLMQITENYPIKSVLSDISNQYSQKEASYDNKLINDFIFKLKTSVYKKNDIFLKKKIFSFFI